jgi:hypothetical protein
LQMPAKVVQHRSATTYSVGSRTGAVVHEALILSVSGVSPFVPG